MEAGQRIQDNKTRIKQLEEHLAEFIPRKVCYETDIQMLKDRNQELREKCETTAQRRDVLVQQDQDVSAKKLDLELRLQQVEEDTKDGALSTVDEEEEEEEKCLHLLQEPEEFHEEMKQEDN